MQSLNQGVRVPAALRHPAIVSCGTSPSSRAIQSESRAPGGVVAPDCEFALLCGFTNAQVDEFLARSREAGCVVGAKALLTSANCNWPLGRLIEAVAAEHAAMGGA